MKRGKLLDHLISNGSVLVREGAKHTVLHNPRVKKTSTVPCHQEVNKHLARKICKDLDISPVE